MKRKKFFLILAANISIISAVFFFSIFLDRIAERFFNASGYFYANYPSVTEDFQLSEFAFTARLNSQGIRNEEVQKEKKKDELRVLAIGDSFTYGWGVTKEQTWEALLESSMEAQGQNTKIINAGKPGASPDDYINICKAYKDQFHPDLIILTSFSDDLAQSADWEGKANEHTLSSLVKYLWPTFTRLKSREIGQKRWRNLKPLATISVSSLFAKSVQAHINKNPLYILNISEKVKEMLMAGKLNPALRTLSLDSPAFFTFYLYDDPFNFALDSFALSMQRLKKECSNDVPVIFAYAPSASFINADYHAYNRELGYDTDQRMVLFDIDSYLKPIVETQNFTFISPVREFRSDGCLDCYYPYDGHFTKEGNLKFADVLFPTVKTQIEKIESNMK